MTISTHPQWCIEPLRPHTNAATGTPALRQASPSHARCFDVAAAFVVRGVSATRRLTLLRTSASPVEVSIATGSDEPLVAHMEGRVSRGMR